MSNQGTDAFVKGLWRDNPVLVLLLGMCPTLAVTNTAPNALTMGLATAFVLIASACIVSAMRGFVPSTVRVATYILVIASLVTAVDNVMQAFMPVMHTRLGAFVSLIVVNCLILGRAEAFASRQPMPLAVLDGAGMGAGFTLSLLAIGSVRELLGQGSWFGLPLMPSSYQPWAIMLLPGGGFFTVGLWLLGISAWRARRGVAATQRDALREDPVP